LSKPALGKCSINVARSAGMIQGKKGSQRVAPLNLENVPVEHADSGTRDSSVSKGFRGWVEMCGFNEAFEDEVLGEGYSRRRDKPLWGTGRGTRRMFRSKGEGHRQCYLANGAGFKGIAGSTAVRDSPHGGYQTEMVEPCGGLPRKCLFIYWAPWARERVARASQPPSSLQRRHIRGDALVR
jgi:hypothetical protein